MMTRQLTAVLSFGIYVFVCVAYGLWLVAGPHTLAETRGVVVGGLVVTAIVATLVSLVVAIPLAIYWGLRGAKDEPADERDRQISRMSMRNAYFVVLTLLWLVPLLALTGSPVLTANVALLTLGVAEIVHYGSRLYYYRRNVTFG